MRSDLTHNQPNYSHPFKDKILQVFFLDLIAKEIGRWRRHEGDDGSKVRRKTVLGPDFQNCNGWESVNFNEYRPNRPKTPLVECSREASEPSRNRHGPQATGPTQLRLDRGYRIRGSPKPMIRRTEGSARERGRRRREMDASGSGSNKKQISSKPSKWRASPISSLGTDHLSVIFSFLDLIQLIRCSIVCKSWNNIIFSSHLMRNLYYARNSRAEENPNVSLSSMRRYLEDLAMEQHKLGFLGPSAEIHQWNAHSVRISLCRMKRGQILTGGEDKVLRLWSAESYSCLDEYVMLKMDPLVDYDFDENKIVGLASARLSILRRNGKRSVFQFSEGSSTHGLCMRYIDPEAVVGCDDGRVRVLDMYSGSCSRIIRMHGGPVTCMSLTEEQLMFGGSTFGTISVADLSTGELVASLKSSFSPTGIRSMNFNTYSHLLFAGSTSGYAHCWDIRTLRPLWETRVSPNVIYSVHHLLNDTSTLAVGGLDGVLRILDQNTGEVLSSFVMDAPATRSSVLEKKRAKTLPEGVRIDSIPRCMRPPITSLAVGLNKIVTAHNDKYINLWRFGK